MTVLRREVGSAVVGTRVRREKHGHRPATRTGNGLHRLHVDSVQVRPLFAIYFDGHKALVDQPRRVGILKALVGHYVAPMAGRVANRQEDGLVLGAG
jgi:hypothetical protein